LRAHKAFCLRGSVGISLIYFTSLKEASKKLVLSQQRFDFRFSKVVEFELILIWAPPTSTSSTRSVPRLNLSKSPSRVGRNSVCLANSPNSFPLSEPNHLFDATFSIFFIIPALRWNINATSSYRFREVKKQEQAEKFSSRISSRAVSSREIASFLSCRGLSRFG